MNQDQFSIWERIQSRINQARLRQRKIISFSNPHYTEAGVTEIEKEAWLNSLPRPLRDTIYRLENQYQLGKFQAKLSLPSYTKNLNTLWILENLLETRLISYPDLIDVLEVGCQDFVRAPAIGKYFASWNKEINLLGLELDAFPILRHGHSRFDMAQYYKALAPGSHYLSQDFFEWKAQASMILSFYPFVSPHPSLAWGLPKEFGNALSWIKAFDRCLISGGLVLVVHQGEWEASSFAEALNYSTRHGIDLQLLSHVNLDCPFYPLPYPALGSLYRKA